MTSAPRTNTLTYHFPLNSYIDDRGIEVTGLTGKVRIPSDSDRATFDDLVGVVGGVVLTENLPCSPSLDVKPRRLIFKRRTGQFSIIAPRREAIIQAATDIIAAFGQDNPIVCVQLEGEEYTNLIGELQTTDVTKSAGTPIQPEPGAAKSRIMYSAVMTEYGTDVPYDRPATSKGFSMISNLASAAPNIAQAAINGCLGARRNTNICSGSSVRFDSRKYTVKFWVTQPNNAPPEPVQNEYYQDLGIPIASREPTEIIACGQALANLESSVCIKYKGESWSDISQYL